ncbi:MAG: hypothetical protein H8E44_06300 [Planctomycetes bacterium]|nr:hypothetical protein [Planctomycetota bacterium]MBL7042896.1 hypothetical protein [Pirellulaceae bacterium]
MVAIRRRAFVILFAAVAACAGAYLADREPSVVGQSSDTYRVRVEQRNPGRSRPADGTYLETLCRERAERLERQLGRECDVVVRSPFVIAGDSNAAALERKHSSTIEPACLAMARQYFHKSPDRPIAVLLFSDERTYRRCAESLFFDRNVSRFGYFKPGRRTILANLAWGDGPLLHELTHALMRLDFPEAAVWLREGLASLHEASSLVSEGGGSLLEGEMNWRLEALERQIQRGRLQGLRDLIHADDFGGPDEALNFAQARYFCLFLQGKDVLSEIYRRYRASHHEDPRGEKAVLLALPGIGWRDLDGEFGRWVMSLSANGLTQRAGT